MLPATRLMASPTIRGRERLEHLEAPAVIVANHASHFDTALLIAALPQAWRDRLAVGAAADYFFTSPLRSAAAALVLGAFPVERKRASAVSARLAVRLLEDGFSLILFPEGGRSPDGWTLPLRPGAAFAAAKTGSPVIPMWITGSEHILPKDAKRVNRGHTTVTIGDPVKPFPKEPPREFHVRVEQALALLCAEASTDWWTALRSGAEIPGGPTAPDWRRRWARGETSGRSRSRWN